MRLAVMNPHMRAKYSGPTVLMNRLFGQIAKSSSAEITAVGPEFPNEKIEQISYVRMATPDLPSAKGQLIWACKVLAWLVKYRRSYDIVHFHGVYSFNLIGAMAPIFLRKRVVLLPLGAGGDLRPEAKSNRIPLIRCLKKVIAKRTHRAFALSDENISELQALGVPRSNILRIPNPASAEFFRAPSLVAERSHNLVLVGKLGRGKRPNLVIEAFHRLQKDSGWREATLTLVGPFESPEFEDEVRTLIKRHGLSDAVHCTGYVSNVAEIMLQIPSAIFILPSAQEGLPGALTEAMAMGMPAIVTDVGAMGEVVRMAGCGRVVEPSVSAISAAVEEIWGDHGVWDDFATSAHFYAKTYFSEESVARKYITGLELGEAG